MDHTHHGKLHLGHDTSKDRERIVIGLCVVLADNYALYFKTHNFHWNVTGPMFQTLHQMFEEQYNELWLATDLIAERIRSLGHFVPATRSELGALTTIDETPGVTKARDMIRQLVEGHEAVARTARALFPIVEKARDEATADLLTQRIQVHEKTSWMLRSLLEIQ